MLQRALRSQFLHKFVSAVAAQALLSAGGFAVNLLLLRYTADAQYGSYVLVLNAIMLVTGIQGAFIAPAMVQRMTAADSAGRASLIGGLYREQRIVVPVVGAGVLILVSALAISGRITTQFALLLAAAVVAGSAALYREFFRMVLMAYRLPSPVLRGDVVYVALLVAGAAAATLTATPALTATLTLGTAAGVTGFLLSVALRRHEAWNPDGMRGIFRQIAVVGAWTTAGSVIHWTFSQGYNYLIVATLSVEAVAASASTRLLTMPVNLLSTGVCSLMLPTASAWVVEHRSAGTLKRLAATAGAVALLAAAYFTLVWIARDFLFHRVLHKDFPGRDGLIILWAIASILMVFRDQLLYLPMTRGRYHQLTLLSAGCAVISLSVSYQSLVHLGVIGAPIGVICGEFVNVIGLIVMSRIEIRRDREG